MSLREDTEVYLDLYTYSRMHETKHQVKMSQYEQPTTYMVFGTLENGGSLGDKNDHRNFCERHFSTF